MNITPRGAFIIFLGLPGFILADMAMDAALRRGRTHETAQRASLVALVIGIGLWWAFLVWLVFVVLRVAFFWKVFG